MSAVDSATQIRLNSGQVPRFTVELPSRTRVFFSNLGEVIFGGLHDHRSASALDINSAAGEFWPDVFVRRRLPWLGFAQSVACHACGGVLLVLLTRFFAMQPRVVLQSPAFDHSQVIYYSPAEDLPSLDTRDTSAPQAEKSDPEFSRQPIISVPREANNRVQTVVAPPRVKLSRNLALPNMVAWGDEKQPRLAIPETPLSPASDVRRLPDLDKSVVSPPPDATRVNQRRNSPTWQSSVVAPPPELRGSISATTYQGFQPDLIAPPPAVQADRHLGAINIGPSTVIAPAPQLPIAQQRTAPGRNAAMGAAAVVPPPPSVAGAGSSGASGSLGRVIALNLHPTLSGPTEDPVGNRRGTFAATPDGRAGASGSAGSSGTGSSTANKANGITRPKNDIPPGLYVGKAEQPSTTAGTSGTGKSSGSVNPNLLAMARPPSLGPAAAASAKPPMLSEPEKAVFAGRRFYSLTLNMPNLNSAGGSWIIRFAELKREPASQNDDRTAAQDLSQPMAIKKVDPAYPTQLMRENVRGTVILYAVIHSDGHVSDVRVLRGADERLDHYAAEAITQWKFQPAMKNGSPVAVEATFQIPFQPTRVGTSF